MAVATEQHVLMVKKDTWHTRHTGLQSLTQCRDLVKKEEVGCCAKSQSNILYSLKIPSTQTIELSETHNVTILELQKH